MLQPFTGGKAIIQLVLTPSWVARINQLAVERGVSRSALIRAAIHAAYFPTASAEAEDVAVPRLEDIPSASVPHEAESDPQQNLPPQPQRTNKRNKRTQRRTPAC